MLRTRKTLELTSPVPAHNRSSSESLTAALVIVE